MNPDLELHPAAEAELLEAEAWYAGENFAAARAFVRDCRSVIISLHFPGEAVVGRS